MCPRHALLLMDHFDFLSDEEIAGMEQAVQTAYGSETSNAE